MTLNSSVNFVIYCIFGEKFKRWVSYEQRLLTVVQMQWMGIGVVGSFNIAKNILDNSYLFFQDMHWPLHDDARYLDMGYFIICLSPICEQEHVHHIWVPCFQICHPQYSYHCLQKHSRPRDKRPCRFAEVRRWHDGPAHTLSPHKDDLLSPLMMPGIKLQWWRRTYSWCVATTLDHPISIQGITGQSF